ncbi:MAG: acyl-CoA/acyl-ACP dehydrogenase [Frankia sp.]|nr:acyl-CoA/acyl-ACP dehydrogenase [Frankia sp.]
MTGVDLIPDETQASIAVAARAAIEAHAPLERLQSLPPAAPVTDDDLWKVAGEQGWFGLHLPGQLGGAGFGLGELALVFQELGRAVVPGPFLGTVLAGYAAAAAGRGGLATEIAEGRMRVGLLEPVADGGARTLDAGEAAAWLMVGPDGAALYDGDAVTVVPTTAPVDPGIRPGDAAVAGPPVLETGGPRLAAVGSVLVAAQLAGICAATRDQSAGYVQVRHQFGVPLGSFQAVKHRCADMAVRAEAAGQLVLLAALALGADRADADLLWPSARSVAADHAMRNAGDNIQNHGAIGYTAEHTAHLFLKRAHSLATLLLTPAELRAAILAAPTTRPAGDRDAAA